MERTRERKKAKLRRTRKGGRDAIQPAGTEWHGRTTRGQRHRSDTPSRRCRLPRAGPGGGVGRRSRPAKRRERAKTLSRERRRHQGSRCINSAHHTGESRGRPASTSKRGNSGHRTGREETREKIDLYQYQPPDHPEHDQTRYLPEP
jgi:hypothetical protein